MGHRREARELALKALFFFDMNKAFLHTDLAEELTLFCSNYEDQFSAEEVKFFFLTLVKGVREQQEKIDSLLDRYSKNWKIFRMPAVDRNIMRIAIFEFLKCSDIPHSVTINEAVEIGKKYGSKDSGAFINGVLDRIKNSEKF